MKTSTRMGSGESVLDDEKNEREKAVLHKLKLTAAYSIAIRILDDELILPLIDTPLEYCLISVCRRVATA
jgi:hypothetical protein